MLQDLVDALKARGVTKANRSALIRAALESVNLAMNSDDFIFDQEIMAQFVDAGMRIAEIPVPTRYFPQASSASFWASCRYGLSIIGVLVAAHPVRRVVAPPTPTRRAPMVPAPTAAHLGVPAPSAPFVLSAHGSAVAQASRS